MADRVPSDHESVRTLRAAVARSGGTRRPCLRLPDGLDVADGDVIRLVIDRTECYARVRADSTGRLLRGAYENRRLARTPGEGANRLVEWLHDHDAEPDDALEFDVVRPGELFGVRRPGERTVYEAASGPPSSLADIARDLDG